MEIRYERLCSKNFNKYSLDSFIRHQEIHECWRDIDGQWKLIPNHFVENWSLEKCREIAADVASHMNTDQSAFGAFAGEQVVGFITVSHQIFGKIARYAQLDCFQVSEPFRGQGIGKRLFSLAVQELEKIDADKLYISAHSSKESQAAYRALGCVPAKEINEKLAAEEPFDVQLEYQSGTNNELL